MHWRDLHEQSTVVDLHNHAVLKRFLLDRDLSASKPKLLAGMFKRAFWPLSQRSTFPLLDKGCLLYTSPSPRDVEESRMPSSA